MQIWGQFVMVLAVFDDIPATILGTDYSQYLQFVSGSS